jgi:hypothetical protein
MRYTVARLSIVLIWIYQGFWCKILGRAPHHAAIAESTPIRGAHTILLALGAVECLLAVWVLNGGYPRHAAMAQTLLLVGMNAGGLVWARRLIPDPAGMLLQNAAFLSLAWIVAEEAGR